MACSLQGRFKIEGVHGKAFESGLAVGDANHFVDGQVVMDFWLALHLVFRA